MITKTFIIGVLLLDNVVLGQEGVFFNVGNSDVDSVIGLLQLFFIMPSFFLKKLLWINIPQAGSWLL